MTAIAANTIVIYNISFFMLDFNGMLRTTFSAFTAANTFAGANLGTGVAIFAASGLKKEGKY